MRFYTYGVGAQLVRELETAGAVAQILHDGNDLIHLQLTSNEQVMIYLIERFIPTYEVRHIFAQNTAAGYYTLFVLWGEMLLPAEGQRYVPADWTESLLAIYRGTLYAYEIYMGHLFMIPVNFKHKGQERVTVYGDPVDVGAIHCHTVHTQRTGLNGAWKVASFDGDPATYRHHTVDADLHHLQPHYAVFDLPPSRDRVAIKRAYRKLARVYHPDVNAAPTAKIRMQQLNIAYNTIMRALDA